MRPRSSSTSTDSRGGGNNDSWDMRSSLRVGGRYSVYLTPRSGAPAGPAAAPGDVDDIVHEALRRLEAHDGGRVRHEVRGGVDVVVVEPSVGLAHQVLHAAHVDRGGPREADHRVDRLDGGVVAAHVEPRLGVHGAGAEIRGRGPHRWRRRRLADIRGTEIEARVRVQHDADRVEVPAVQYLDADNGSLF